MNDDISKSEWNNCPEGKLNEVVSHLHREQRRESFRKIFSVAFVACFIFVIASLQWGKPLDSDGQFRMLSCAEVIQLMPQYKAGKLDTRSRREVEAHLAVCPQCRIESERLANSRRSPSRWIFFAHGN